MPLNRLVAVEFSRRFQILVATLLSACRRRRRGAHSRLRDPPIRTRSRLPGLV